MASLEDVLYASALDALNVEDYWPAFDSTQEIDEAVAENEDGEYPMILLFYENLFDHLLSRSLVCEDDVKQAIRYLVYNYGKMNGGKTPDDLDYGNLSNCFGYLHRYAACHTAMVRHVMVKVFHTTPPDPIRRMLCIKTEMNVVSLGGGPGNDIFGFCSALYGKHYGLTRMTLTVVDKMTGWERVFFAAERILRGGDFGNVGNLFKEVNIVTFYMLANLTDGSCWDRELRSKLADADFVLLVKVLSIVPDSEKIFLLKNTVMSLRPGGFLVFIDCPFPFHQFKEVEQWLDLVFELPKKKFPFQYEVNRLGYSNITMSQAHVRIYKKKFLVHE